MGEMSLLGELSLGVLTVIPVLPSRTGLRARHRFDFSQPDAGCICPVWVEKVSSMRLVSRSLGSQLCQCYGEPLPSCDIVLLESGVVQKCCCTLINVHKRDNFHQLLGWGGCIVRQASCEIWSSNFNCPVRVQHFSSFQISVYFLHLIGHNPPRKGFSTRTFLQVRAVQIWVSVADLYRLHHPVLKLQCIILFYFFSWWGKCRTAEVNRLGSRQTPLLVWVAFPLNAGKEGKKFFPRKFSEGRRCDGAVVLLGLLQVRCASDKKIVSISVVFFKKSVKLLHQMLIVTTVFLQMAKIPGCRSEIEQIVVFRCYTGRILGNFCSVPS